MYRVVVALAVGCATHELPSHAPLPAHVDLGSATVFVRGAAAERFDGPEPGAAAIGVLPPWTPGNVLARGASCIATGTGHCSERWLVATGAGSGWVNGSSVLIRVEHPLLHDDLGGYWLDGTPHTTDGSSTPSRVWFGLDMTWKYSAEFGRDRAAFQGVMVVPTTAEPVEVPIGSLSGWGSSERIQGSRWQDMNGDGRAELLVALSEIITEAGYGGQKLVVYDDLQPVLTVPVHDPRRSGLDQQQFGTVAVHGDRIVAHRTRSVPCDPEVAPPDSETSTWLVTTCIQAETTTWVGMEPSVTPLTLTANGSPIVAFYSEPGPSEGSPPPQVAIQTAEGHQWLPTPTLDPAWLAETHGAPEGSTQWLDLYPDD